MRCITQWLILRFIIHQIFSLTHDWSKWEIFPSFQNCAYCEKYLKDTKHKPSIWCKNMLGYLAMDIICSLKLTVFLELHSWKTVCFLKQKMSVDKYPIIFSHQMEAIVYISCRTVHTMIECPSFTWALWQTSLSMESSAINQRVSKMSFV